MPPMKKIPCGKSCYACRHSSGSITGKGLYYHCIPRKLTSRPTRDKWLEFLHLPPSSRWPNKLYQKITLCSLHFKESDYPSRLEDYFRVKLVDGTVPSENRPSEPGPLGDLFVPEFPEACSTDPPKGHPTYAPDDDDGGDGELDFIFDSTTIDHDYIATTIPRKSEVPVSPQHNQEDWSKLRTLDNLRKELCRLCGQKGSPLVAIFGPTSVTSPGMPVSSKIDMHLPIKVKLQDPLPFSICSNCFEVLNHWHELYVTCVAADAVLWKTFGTERNKTSLNIQDCDVSSEVQQNAARRAEVQTQTEISLELEIKAKDDLNCEQCGYSKSEIVQTEGKSFAEEFDKRLTTYRHVSYKCRFCFELFKNSADRKNHMAMCRQLSTICELCGHTVSCRKDLKRHNYKKHNNKKVIRTYTYLCDKCDRCFKSAAGLNFHIENIHNVQDHAMKYYCELCCTVFMREIYLRNHKKKHEKGKVKSVFQIEAFRQEESSEGTENNVVYSCPVCQEIFSDVLSLVVHLTTKKNIKCLLCQKIMSCEKRFFLHVCGQWTCQYCLKSFDKKVKWIYHERLHTGEKPIKCRKCEQTFRTWQSRRRHETHHEPSYQCSYCTKSFRNKYVFQDHVSCHEGKIFSCQFCDKKFSGRRNLGKHINMFHKVKKSVCISE